MNIMNFNTVAKCTAGADLTILDFEGDATDIKIKVIGVDSKGFKSQINKLTKLNERNKAQDADKMEEDSIRTLVAITLGWSGVEDDKGKAIPYSDEMAEEIYSNSPHIANQVINFAKDRTNFLG